MQNGIKHGETDLIFAGAGGGLERACACIGAWLMLGRPGGLVAFPQVAVVVPRWRSPDGIDFSNRVAMTIGTADATALEKRLVRRVTADARLETLLDAIGGVAPEGAVYVTFADDYEPAHPADLSGAEARRAARLTNTVDAVARVAKERRLYVLLDAGCDRLVRAENVAQLRERPDVGIYTLDTDDERRAIVEREERWRNLVSRGAEQIVRAELGGLGVSDENADTTVAVMYAATDDHQAAWKIIGPRARSLAAAAEPSTFIELAGWAFHAGARADARALLSELANARPVLDVSAFQRGFLLSLRVDDAGVAALLEERARELHPTAFHPEHVRLHHALEAGDYVS